MRSDEDDRPLTGALARFTRDLTAEARAGRLEPVRCRESEVDRVIDILLRHGKNNPALVGPAGVGKTAIVEGLAQRLAAGTVPLVLRSSRVLALDHVSLLAGTTYRGQYEERIRVIVDETSADPDALLFIDELHNLIGQGTAFGVAMDAANMLKPALVRGDFRVIGATTDEEYDRWVRGDPALERRFQRVLVRELSSTETREILEARRSRLEAHHHVIISDEALGASIALTDAHLTDRRRPDRAIDVLDEACAHLQAVASYSPRAAELILGRRTRARRPNGRAAAPAAPVVEEDPLDDIATGLKRFGAELEAMLVGAPGGASASAAPSVPTSAPAVSPHDDEGARHDELFALLRAEGIVVRGADVARVVAIATGQQVSWVESSPSE